jgi:TctA family transporter
MLGNPNWFTRRKYGGWGICPKTWQGWVYLAVILIPFAVFQSLPFWSTEVRMYVTIGWMTFLLLDVSHIMLTLKRDEREHKIEALAERNAAWAMIAILCIGVCYQVIASSLQQKPIVDPFLIGALVAGLVAKSVSNIVLERRAL